MRLHEVSRNLNIGIDTIADFLFSKGMPLEDKNLNSRLKDAQCSLLYREFGYSQSVPQVKPKRTFPPQEKPEVQAILREIHLKRRMSKKEQTSKENTIVTKKETTKETKKEKKAKKEQLREQELKQIKGQKVKLKIKGFSNHILYTKGYGNLFVEGRVLLSDVYYNGNRLNDYWAEALLKGLKSKTEFVVEYPQVKIEGGSEAYVRLRYDVIPDPLWQKYFKQIQLGTELLGRVIDIVGNQYIVKYSVGGNYFIWGGVDMTEYFDSYEINSPIKVCVKHIGTNLFAPYIFTNKERVLDETELPKVEFKPTPSTEGNDFITWRENQKKELEHQREQLLAAESGDSQETHNGQTTTDTTLIENGVEKNNAQARPSKLAEEIECEEKFFDDYDVEGQTLDGFLYFDKTISFDEFLLSTGTIVLRYKILIALADLINAYHKENLILGNLETTNFVITSDDPILLKMVDDSNASYKTSIIHLPENNQLMAPEVKSHLSPITPMSECYSFASLVYQMLTGEEYRITNDFSKTYLVAPSILDILFQSLSSDPMLRPKMSKWCDALRLGLGELTYCPQCHQWHVLSPFGRCPICRYKAHLPISLNIAHYGEAEIYNLEHNIMEIKPTIVGKAKGNIIITENTSKILYGYHLGMSVKKDQPIAAITITQCNSNNDITLHIIPMSGAVFTSLDEKYIPRDDAFDDETNIAINGDDLFGTMFLVESKTFRNKILKICHI